MASGKSRISLEEIRKKFLIPGKPVSSHLLTRLRRDSRIGAQRLYEALTARFERERSERVRLDAMLNFERVLWKSGVRDIAGVDEAGVGPLAGPVVAAAVMFTADPDICGIDDSKRLDAPTRELLAAEIRAKSAGIGIGIASVGEIDTVNIYHAALLAMRRAVEALPRPPQHVLVDARTVPGVAAPQNSFNKGDGINFSIAAASIRARCRPEYSRIMASCTMVSSRCVAGLSTGTRAFSAIATMTMATRPRPSETRKPTEVPSSFAAMIASEVVPTSSETVKITISMAGSASEAIISSRLEPMPPKLVPTSSPASAVKKRAPPRRATSTMRSTLGPSRRSVLKAGISAAPSQMAAKVR